MNRIFVCGDTHGVLDLGKLERLCENNKLDYFDYVIICGDCGVLFDRNRVDYSISRYNKLKTNILFIDGNHENFDLLNKFDIEEFCGGKIHKIDEHIIHLMRGQIYNINGKIFLTIGGANSSDIDRRKEHISWWKDEEITNADIEEMKDNLKKYNNKVDYVITHTPSTKTLNDFIEILTQCGEAIPYYLQNKVCSTKSSDLLDYIGKNVKFKKWYCGHLHTDEILGKVQLLYSNIVEI